MVGYPDNVKINENGELWVAMPALRDFITNFLDHNPYYRRAILNTRLTLQMFMKIANM